MSIRDFWKIWKGNGGNNFKNTFVFLIRRFGKWGFRFVAVLLFLIFALYFILLIPAVQHWVLSQIDQSLESRLETEVEIKSLRLPPFSNLILEGFNIGGFHQDTIIHFDQLEVAFDLNPITLFRSGIVVESVELNNGQIQFRREAMEPRSSFPILLERLFTDPDQEKRERGDFMLDIDDVYLNDTKIIKYDVVTGEDLTFFIDRGHLQVDEVDIKNKLIKLHQMDFFRVHITGINHDRVPMPDSLLYVPPPPDSTRDTTLLTFQVKRFDLTDSRVTVHNYRNAPQRRFPESELEFNHLEVGDINFEVADFVFDVGLNFEGKVLGFSFQEQSGFKVENITTDYGRVTSKGFQLYGLKIKTPYSEIGDTLIFTYNQYLDFLSFPQNVVMDGRLSRSRVTLNDIMTFSKTLRRNRFFIENRWEQLTLDGRFFGTINELNGENLNITLADRSTFDGNFSSFNLAEPGSQFLDFKVNRLNTSVETLEKLFPNLAMPKGFKQLGQLFFTGSFYGYFHDFVAYGSLLTNIGRAEMDLNLKTEDGPETAIYSGGLTLHDFDLGQWTQNPDFGILNAVTSIENGIGITGESVNATLTTRIENFAFRDYPYENVFFEGTLNKQLLDGTVTIEDDNVDFAFNGRLNFGQELSQYNFEAQINKIDFKNLNLLDKNWVLKGGIALNLTHDRKARNIAGETFITDLFILADDTEEIPIGDITGTSQIDALGMKTVTVESDFMSGKINGDFYLSELLKVFQQYFWEYQPETASRLSIPVQDTIETSQFEWDIQIADSKGINYLVSPALKPIQGLSFVGKYDGTSDTSDLRLMLPNLGYNNLAFQNVELLFKTKGPVCEVQLGVQETVLNQKREFPAIALTGMMESDTAQFLVVYDTESNVVHNELNLPGKLFPLDSTGYAITLDTFGVDIFNDPWRVSEDNQIVIFKDSLSIDQFSLANKVKDQSIELSSVGKKGLKFRFAGAELGYIDTIWNYDPLDFGGNYQVEAQVSDAFKLEGIYGEVVSDTVYINGDDWGWMKAIFSTDDLKSRLTASAMLTNDSMQSQLITKGYYNLQDLVENPTEKEDQKNYYDFKLNVAGFPLSLAEYFLANSISNTVGKFQVNTNIYGFPDQLNIDGTLEAHNGAITVDFLNTRYSFDHSLVRINNKLFDASNTILKDELGNEAVVYGGVSHERLKNLGFNAVLETPAFMGLNTGLGDNDYFYGRALGAGTVSFSGSFQQPNIYVNATTTSGTKMVIPLDSETSDSELTYIKFVNKEEERERIARGEENERPEILKGVSLEMDLTFTEDANMEIVFDRQAGDIMRGTGKGDIRIVLPRAGDFQMFGNYGIAQGDYLFTWYNLVNKKFQITEGGQIQWDGDPFNAQINVEAEYSDLNASVANLIQEYLTGVNENLQADASIPTQVDLKMQLRGKLLNPVITFDIDFPQLRGLLETYARNKLRLLEQDQNELYKQVFGLITMGQFIPSEFDFRGAGNNLIYNTLSEFVSNQLSLLITDLFSEFIEDGEVLSGIDFDISYNPSQQVNIDGQNISAGEELEVKLRQDFFNDNLSVIIGGNIDLGGNLSAASGSSGTFVGNDLVIEYIINRDRSLKLKIYQRLLPTIGGGSRLQLGTGISFRREFDTFGEFLESFKRDARKNGKGKKAGSK